ncbi:hypothetical protein CEXT_737691 [Caerostris extrusa]|uniref:Uncharacterized protein n=1 Tax=Caerostris extrusa TaxID=172846 RepID=A0AAV4Y8Q1_CAEEX|nr:hypothetical protein CEXT_737691 [Caerostris extrusa]
MEEHEFALNQPHEYGNGFEEEIWKDREIMKEKEREPNTRIKGRQTQAESVKKVKKISKKRRELSTMWHSISRPVERVDIRNECIPPPPLHPKKRENFSVVNGFMEEGEKLKGMSKRSYQLQFSAS